MFAKIERDCKREGGRKRDIGWRTGGGGGREREVPRDGQFISFHGIGQRRKAAVLFFFLKNRQCIEQPNVIISNSWNGTSLQIPGYQSLSYWSRGLIHDGDFTCSLAK